MSLRITGKNMDIGTALRGHVEDKIEEALAKYFAGGYSGHVTMEREGSGFRTDCSIHLDSGTVLHSTGLSVDPHQSADQASARIEKRLRRYKRRLKDHQHDKAERAAMAAASYVTFATPDEDEEPSEGFAPTVVAETETHMKTLTVASAVLDLDFSGAPVVLFRNAGTGRVNVVYRRNDGNIGWIDPTD
ncbi:MAG: ribosome-associated translation inhibitor RaiA [Devosiaceae bacterium]|nr:ribosome-associated translation inhibitor RaiA [Devosiaceae bacterium MH13]